MDFHVVQRHCSRVALHGILVDALPEVVQSDKPCEHDLCMQHGGPCLHVELQTIPSHSTVVLGILCLLDCSGPGLLIRNWGLSEGSRETGAAESSFVLIRNCLSGRRPASFASASPNPNVGDNSPAIDYSVPPLHQRLESTQT